MDTMSAADKSEHFVIFVDSAYEILFSGCRLAALPGDVFLA